MKTSDQGWKEAWDMNLQLGRGKRAEKLLNGNEWGEHGTNRDSIDMTVVKDGWECTIETVEKARGMVSKTVDVEVWRG